MILFMMKLVLEVPFILCIKEKVVFNKLSLSASVLTASVFLGMFQTANAEVFPVKGTYFLSQEDGKKQILTLVTGG